MIPLVLSYRVLEKLFSRFLISALIRLFKLLFYRINRVFDSFTTRATTDSFSIDLLVIITLKQFDLPISQRLS